MRDPLLPFVIYYICEVDVIGSQAKVNRFINVMAKDLAFTVPKGACLCASNTKRQWTKTENICIETKLSPLSTIQFAQTHEKVTSFLQQCS